MGVGNGVGVTTVCGGNDDGCWRWQERQVSQAESRKSDKSAANSKKRLFMPDNYSARRVIISACPFVCFLRKLPRRSRRGKSSSGPASVVKELLENSLDAGARSITITIEEAGKKLIEVADDGSGIPSAELELAVSRHATSKLVRSDELFSISTLGFRGEALASIGSVSRMTVTSRVQNEQEGARLRVEGGMAGKLTKVGTTVGTTVRVEDLFYNVPARLKFLKSDTTERRATDMLVTRYALAYPENGSSYPMEKMLFCKRQAMATGAPSLPRCTAWMWRNKCWR